MTSRETMSIEEFRVKHPDLFEAAAPLWNRAYAMFNDEVDRVGAHIDWRALRERFQATLTPEEVEILRECPDDPMSASDLRNWGLEDLLD